MGRLRTFLFRKRAMFRGVSFVLAVAVFTIITLVSCAGITHPCVTCNRGPASDPFVQAEQVSWDGMSSGEKSDEDTAEGKRARRTNRADLER